MTEKEALNNLVKVLGQGQMVLRSRNKGTGSYTVVFTTAWVLCLSNN